MVVLGGILAPSWRSWGYLGLSWSQVGGLGAILAPSWRVLGSSWLQLGGSWGHLGSNLGFLGCLGHHAGRFWGPSWGSLWHHVASLSIYQKPSNFNDFSMFFEGSGGLSWCSLGACWLKVRGLVATWGHLGFLLI